MLYWDSGQDFTSYELLSTYYMQTRSKRGWPLLHRETSNRATVLISPLRGSGWLFPNASVRSTCVFWNENTMTDCRHHRQCQPYEKYIACTCPATRCMRYPMLHHCGHEQHRFPSFSSTSGHWFAALSPFFYEYAMSFGPTFSSLSILVSWPLARFYTWVSVMMFPFIRLTEGVDVSKIDLKILQG